MSFPSATHEVSIADKQEVSLVRVLYHPALPLVTSEEIRDDLPLVIKRAHSLLDIPAISQPMSQRAKHFKAGVGRDEARRGRNETQVQIRKEKKEDRLNQRRRKGLEASGGGGLFGFGAAQDETPSTTMGTSTAVVDAGTQMRVSWMQCAYAYFLE